MCSSCYSSSQSMPQFHVLPTEPTPNLDFLIISNLVNPFVQFCHNPRRNWLLCRCCLCFLYCNPFHNRFQNALQHGNKKHVSSIHNEPIQNLSHVSVCWITLCMWLKVHLTEISKNCYAGVFKSCITLIYLFRCTSLVDFTIFQNMVLLHTLSLIS